MELCLTSYEVLGSEPGEDWQVDFTMRPKTSNFQYLPVFIDTSKRWAEASPRPSEKASEVKLFEAKFLQVWIAANNSDDRGAAFVAEVPQVVPSALGSQWQHMLPRALN